MVSIELFLWAIAGGLLVTTLSAGAVLYNKEKPNTKHLSRDFILGAAFTGFLYPLIPESFDDMKAVLTTAGGGITTRISDGISTTIASTSKAVSFAGVDPGVQVGPANF
jgi:hypothetical protein